MQLLAFTVLPLTVLLVVIAFSSVVLHQRAMRTLVGFPSVYQMCHPLVTRWSATAAHAAPKTNSRGQTTKGSP